MVKTRFAPSPTGPMHLGSVRTALFTHCLARREKGVILLRGRGPTLSRNLRTARRLYGDGIEMSDAAARVLAGAPSGFFDEALEICGRFSYLPGLAGALKTRLGLCGKALLMPLRAALRIDGPDLADPIALMPRECIRERFAALIEKP